MCVWMSHAVPKSHIFSTVPWATSRRLRGEKQHHEIRPCNALNFDKDYDTHVKWSPYSHIFQFNRLFKSTTSRIEGLYNAQISQMCQFISGGFNQSLKHFLTTKITQISIIVITNNVWNTCNFPNNRAALYRYPTIITHRASKWTIFFLQCISNVAWQTRGEHERQQHEMKSLASPFTRLKGCGWKQRLAFKTDAMWPCHHLAKLSSSPMTHHTHAHLNRKEILIHISCIVIGGRFRGLLDDLKCCLTGRQIFGREFILSCR